MTTQDLDHIRFVTRHFNALQGLRRTVPLGLLFLVQGIATGTRSPYLLIFGGIVVMGLFLLPIKNYYKTLLGEVEQPLEHPEAWSSPWFYLAMALLLGGILVFTLGGYSFIQSGYALFSMAFLATWIRRRCRLSQAHYLVFGGLLLGLAVLAGSFASVPPTSADTGMVFSLAGAACIVAGLLDHWQLVRTLGHPLTPQMKEPS